MVSADCARCNRSLRLYSASRWRFAVANSLSGVPISSTSVRGAAGVSATIRGVALMDARQNVIRMPRRLSEEDLRLSDYSYAMVEPADSQDPELLRRLLRAKDRMDAASHEEWPVRRLARVSGVSAAHFARSFKEAFGVPPHRYLLTRRIERATALLRDTEMSITKIAFHTGWGSLGTFGQTFRDITGQNPGALRTRGRAAGRDLGRVPNC